MHRLQVKSALNPSVVRVRAPAGRLRPAAADPTNIRFFAIVAFYTRDVLNRTMMWVRRSAIRPVPAYARISAHVLDALRESLSDDDEQTRAKLDEAFERFERKQGPLSTFVTEVLGKPLDETALGLGYFLTLAVWLSFEQAHGSHIASITEQELKATRELLTLDEQLRQTDPSDVLDTDDIVAMEQPDLLEFIHEHVDATLEAHASDIDVDDVHEVYRVLLTELLALSYAVERPAGYPVAKTELLA